ncbi:hypothetical protein ARAM_007227 [Aspergillus rambellii]|uniref:Glycosyl transferase n=1 Tax=Aspergillus rambellii TaxID=308745 RepID=A0A0F8V3Q3_9EURO|nr:hypothetical protein ARAM_007227 [Aspergillus rambellii]
MTSKAQPNVSRAGRIMLHCLRKKCHYTLAIALILVLLYPFRSTILPTEVTVPEPIQSRKLSAYELLSRPVAKDWTTIPKIIHQTWFPAGSNMSQNAQSWVQTIIDHHPDWEYVLWDDETNELLVQQYFPWFLDTYRALPKEINRADMVRNFYMYLFGGMYADVDTEALRPVDPLFAGHSVSLASHWDVISSAAPAQNNPVQRAFLGRMAHAADIESSAAVPNGWMASPPGHPFWLLPVLYVLENPKGGDGSVEAMTGPTILGPLIKQYYGNHGHESLRRQLCRRVRDLDSSWELFCPLSDPEEISDSLKHSLVLLPREQIYPYSWVDDGKITACLGAASNPSFDPEECKRRMDVEAWPSYFITYCTHTW